MGIKDKKFVYYGGSLKNLIFFTKKAIYRGDCLGRRAWTVCRFKRGLGKKGSGVFERN